MYTINGYLCHHGILGMKWGKRQGPPYPLDASDHSASEKKAGYKKSLGGGRNEELYGNQKSISKRTAKKIIKGIQKASKKEELNAVNQKVTNAIEKRIKVNFDSIDEKKKELHDFQEKNKENLIKLEEDIYNEKISQIDERIEKIWNKAMKEEGLKKEDKDDNIVWLEEEAYYQLLSEADDQYANTGLGKKERELVDNLMKEYSNVGKQILGKYADVSLKNVITWKNGEKKQATLQDAIDHAIWNLDNTREKHK